MNGIAVTIQFKLDAFDKVHQRVDVIRIQNIEYYVNSLFQIFSWHKIIDANMVNIVDIDTNKIELVTNIHSVSDTDIDQCTNQYPAKKRNKICQCIRWFKHLVQKG